MANYRLIFAVLFVIMVFFSGFLLFNSSIKDDRLEEADKLSSSVYQYLRLIDARCRQSPSDFKGINGCVQRLVDELEEVADLEEDNFQEYRPEENQTGFIILVNDGRHSLNSSLFRLYRNRQLMDTGCAIPGTIDKGYVCKLNFEQPCRDGDVLEVTYDGSRAYLRTC